MDRRMQEIIVVTLSAIIVLLVALNSGIFYFRADITENHVYTISKVSRNLFKDIPEEVTITYYLSDRLKSLAPQTQEVQDLLYEYAAHSHGKIKVSVVDPVKSGAERQMSSLGIVPQQVQVIEHDQQSVAQVYSGIVLSYLDRTKALPVVFDTTTLEYELTSSIKHLVANTNPVLGILLGDSGQSLDQDYQLLSNGLSRYYDVRSIKPGETIPGDVSVLFVIGAKDLDTFDLFPVDQYIMNGGKALFAVSGVNVDLKRNLQATASGDTPLLSMLKEYGATVQQELVLDTHDRRIPLRQPQGNIMVQTLEAYPMWVAVQSQNVNQTNPITARFSGLDLLWPSPIEISKRDGLTAEPLVSSSSDSWLMKSPFYTNPSQIPMLRKDAQTTGGPYVLGAALSGTFTSYFKGKQIPTRQGVKRDWSKVVPSVKDARMIVIGNSDFASNLLQYSNSRYNITFLENAAEWLASEDALLSIKTRAERDLQLDRIQDPSAKQAVVLFAELLNIYLIPIGVIIFGIVRSYRRREKAYAKGGEKS